MKKVEDVQKAMADMFTCAVVAHVRASHIPFSSTFHPTNYLLTEHVSC